MRGFVHPRYTREKLGHMSWELLHLISAFVPETFDNSDEAELGLFLTLLYSELIQCQILPLQGMRRTLHRAPQIEALHRQNPIRFHEVRVRATQRRQRSPQYLVVTKARSCSRANRSRESGVRSDAGALLRMFRMAKCLKDGF